MSAVRAVCRNLPATWRAVEDAFACMLEGDIAAGACGTEPLTRGMGTWIERTARPKPLFAGAVAAAADTVVLVLRTADAREKPVPMPFDACCIVARGGQSLSGLVPTSGRRVVRRCYERQEMVGVEEQEVD